MYIGNVWVDPKKCWQVSVYDDLGKFEVGLIFNGHRIKWAGGRLNEYIELKDNWLKTLENYRKEIVMEAER